MRRFTPDVLQDGAQNFASANRVGSAERVMLLSLWGIAKAVKDGRRQVVGAHSSDSRGSLQGFWEPTPVIKGRAKKRLLQIVGSRFDGIVPVAVEFCGGAARVCEFFTGARVVSPSIQRGASGAGSPSAWCLRGRCETRFTAKAEDARRKTTDCS